MSQTIDIDSFRGLIDKAEVKCLICGWSGHSIVAHLKQAHQLTAGQYQKKFPRDKHPDARLCSPVVSELLRRYERESKTTDDLANFTRLFEVQGGTPAYIAAAKQQIKMHDPAYLKHATPLVEDPYYYFEEENTKLTLAAITMGKSAYISGPTQCGKTSLYMQTLQRLGKACLRMNMNGDATVRNFLGHTRADPGKGTYYSYGALPICMMGGLTLILDEVDYTPPQIAAVTHPVLEGSRQLYIPDTDEVIHAHPGFSVLATGNTSGKGDPSGVYTGTEIMNTAFLERFAVKMTADYLNSDREEEMLTRRFPTANIGKMRALIKAANLVREAFKQGNLAFTYSTKKLIDYFELEPICGHETSLKTTLLNWLDGSDIVLVEGFLQRAGVALSSPTKPPPKAKRP